MKDTFPQRIAIRSMAALQRATALILAYRHEQQKAESDLETALQQVREKFAGRFQCRVGKSHTLPISERIAQLESAVEKYTTGSQEKVFEPGRQTTRIGSAQVQLRNEAGRIEFLPGMNRRTSAMGIVSRTTGFQTAFAKLLIQFGLGGWIAPAWDLDWDGIKRGIKSGEITAEELEEAGMYWNEPTRVRVSNKPQG